MSIKSKRSSVHTVRDLSPKSPSHTLSVGAPRRRSVRSLGSEREPATLRCHRPRCVGSAALGHLNRRRYRWVCPATPPSPMRVPNPEPSSPSLTPLAPPRLFGAHFDDFACQADGTRFDIGVLGTSWPRARRGHKHSVTRNSCSLLCIYTMSTM